MLNSTVLQRDKSFDTFSPADGEALPKALCHQAICLDVDAATWYIYHQRNYDPKTTTGGTEYIEENWRAQ
jgi:hypothetical protein